MLLITDGFPRGLGYYEIDQRAVHAPLPPGVTPHFEADAYTCRHCQRVVVKNQQRTRERYHCRGCDHYICDGCAAERFLGAPCRTFAQKADEALERAARQPDPPSIILP